MAQFVLIVAFWITTFINFCYKFHYFAW